MIRISTRHLFLKVNKKLMEDKVNFEKTDKLARRNSKIGYEILLCQDIKQKFTENLNLLIIYNILNNFFII